MNQSRNVWAILLLVLCATIAPAQPDDDKAGADERDPSLKHWQWMFELRLPDKADGPYLALPIPPEVFGKTQMDVFGKEPDDLRDVRLTDAKGTRIPYALRIMRDRYEQINVSIIRTFNAAASPKSRIYEASYELANAPAPGYNEIEIGTTGRNFRRKVEVFGDDADKFAKPKSLLGKGKYLVHYDVDGKVVDIHRFRFDYMQYRYLQVRVHADDFTVDEEIPEITSVTVRRRIEIPGESVTEPATLNSMGFTRGDGGPATAWMILLPDRMPCEKLTFDVFGAASERPMRLEIADEKQARRTVFGADWRWLPGDDKRQTLEVRFNEVVAQRLRLVITDNANQPLNIQNVKATRSVRKLIFAKPEEGKFTLPLRLYTGNPSAGATRYDLVKNLPVLLKPAPSIATLEPGQLNPTYEAPPKTLDQRMPWLVHVVLGAASLILLLILAALARQAIRRHDQTQPDQAAAGPATP